MGASEAIIILMYTIVIFVIIPAGPAMIIIDAGRALHIVSGYSILSQEHVIAQQVT